jgi:hypothetical protein
MEYQAIRAAKLKVPPAIARTVPAMAPRTAGQPLFLLNSNAQCRVGFAAAGFRARGSSGWLAKLFPTGDLHLPFFASLPAHAELSQERNSC